MHVNPFVIQDGGIFRGWGGGGGGRLEPPLVVRRMADVPMMTSYNDIYFKAALIGSAILDIPTSRKSTKRNLN